MSKAWLWIGLWAATAIFAHAETRQIEHPRWQLDKAHALSYQASAKIRERRLQEAMSLLGQSRATILNLRERWPSYRRLSMAREFRAVQLRMNELSRLVEKRGLVEFRGRFYSFEHVKEMLDSRVQRTQKWLEMQQAREKAQKMQMDRLAKQEEALRSLNRHIQQDKALRRQEELDRQMKRQEQEARRNIPLPPASSQDKS